MCKFCQSCGMPMKKDPYDGGANADGSINADYCSYCYQQGVFVQADLTARQMQDFCVEKLREKGVPRFLGRLLTYSIPKLKRWKQP